MARNSINPWQPAGQAGFQNLPRLVSLRWVLPERPACRWCRVSPIHHPLIPLLQPREGMLGQQQVFPASAPPPSELGHWEARPHTRTGKGIRGGQGGAARTAESLPASPGRAKKGLRSSSACRRRPTADGLRRLYRLAKGLSALHGCNPTEAAAS